MTFRIIRWAGSFFVFASTATPCAIAQTINSAMGEPAGYYAGLEEPVLKPGVERWQEWFRSNAVQIADIRAKVAQMREGTLVPGCIGRDRFTCVATLAQTLAVADYFPISKLFKEEDQDVNGKQIAAAAIHLGGFIPGVKQGQYYENKIRLMLRLNRSGAVTKVEASLIKDPTFAKTQAEYDKTGLYEVIAAMSLAKCPNLSPNDVARFFENRVKPKSRFTGEEASFTSGISISNDRQAKNVSFCGRKIDFDSVWGNGSDFAASTNPHGVFGGMILTFK